MEVPTSHQRHHRQQQVTQRTTMITSQLFDFAVITIFARETLEGGVIIGEYRTVILRSDWGSNEDNEMMQGKALSALNVAAVGAAALALIICSAVAIPLAILSRDFNNRAALIIEGVSKIVAAICILQLSLKLPKFFGLYTSKKQKPQKMDSTDDEAIDDRASADTLSISSIRFNVAWNIWREVAECGVFLIPFFLSGEGVLAIPLSALVGFIVGGLVCLGIYRTNQKLHKPLALTIFSVTLLLLLSTGLFCGGCHKLELVYGKTPTVWSLRGDVWSTDRLPMTILKPFGYSDSRTVLQMVSFWGWLICSIFFHYQKWKTCCNTGLERRDSQQLDCTNDDKPRIRQFPETMDVDTRSTFSNDNAPEVD